jgi:DNA mismatch repair protein MutS2
MNRYEQVLELPAILDRLAEHASFSAGKALATTLAPSTDLDEVLHRQVETAEARRLLEVKPDLRLGGVHDLRPFLETASRGARLLPHDLLNIRDTLDSTRRLKRSLLRLQESFPQIAGIARRFEACPELIAEIERCISDHAEVLDGASAALGRIRSQLKVAHDRLMDRLNRILTNSRNATYLQEAYLTQRDGRYVIPVKADFKGRIPGLVHDQSASGATLFIEPMATVTLNNEWRELQLAEQHEIERILLALSGQVAEREMDITLTVNALADLDLALAKAKYADSIAATMPEMVPFREPPKARRARHRRQDRRGGAVIAAADTATAAADTAIADVGRDDAGREDPAPTSESGTGAVIAPVRHPGSTVDLRQARHPLLDPRSVVPIDVATRDNYYIIVITGPNTGGKTVSLKTVGLLAMMAQCGLHLPVAEGSRLSVFEQICADIGDEQSIEQSLSTFSSHMSHIIEMLESADERSLLLLDELGAGTDPLEGAALAQALLLELQRRRITALATTHYAELKVFAEQTPGVINASVEFDVETLAPTYHLTVGLPGQSNAFAIASRLGLARTIVDRARGLVSATHLEAERFLVQIKEAQAQAAKARAQAEQASEEAREQAKELRARLESIDKERADILAEAWAQARQELEAARDELASLRRKMGVMGARAVARAAPAEIEAELDALDAVLTDSQTARVSAFREATIEALGTDDATGTRDIEVGDTVWVPDLNATGEVLTLEDNAAEVQVGAFRVRTRRSALQLRHKAAQAAERVDGERASGETDAGVALPPDPSVSLELHLRGLRVDDALPQLEQYLDNAYRSQVPFVRVVHGKGTGALRKAVREYLHEHPLVSSFRSGEQGEGDTGVTVVKFAPR